MSTKAARTPEPDLRGEIEYLLANRGPDFERGHTVATAWTVEAIAKAVDASRSAVKRELEQLVKEGRITSRLHRPSGKVLWKLTDEYDVRWAAFAGPAARIDFQRI